MISVAHLEAHLTGEGLSSPVPLASCLAGLIMGTQVQPSPRWEADVVLLSIGDACSGYPAATGFHRWLIARGGKAPQPPEFQLY